MDKLKAVRGIALGVILGALAWGLLIGGSVEAFSQEVPPVAQQQTFQAVCLPLDRLREQLKTKFNEDEVGGGIVGETAITLLFASPDGDTWTIVMLSPDGNACVVAGGSDWFHARIPAKGERAA
jgi:hypothetical protein